MLNFLRIPPLPSGFPEINYLKTEMPVRAPCVWILFLVFPLLNTFKQGFGHFILLYSLNMLQIDFGTILQANYTLLLLPNIVTVTT